MKKTKKIVKKALKNPNQFDPAEVLYMQFWLSEHKRQKQIKKAQKQLDV